MMVRPPTGGETCGTPREAAAESSGRVDQRSPGLAVLPRTDVARMTRLQRLTSAMTFLLWGFLFLGLWLGVAYMTFGLGLISQDNVVVQVLSFGLALLAGCGLIGGLYLLVRVII